MEIIKPQRRILRSPSVKRKTKLLPVDQRVKLERVLGVTVSTNSSLACDSNNGTIAYPAGCVTVLFNPQRNKQTHIFNSCRKFISAVAFSGDGKYLVTGENGHQPAVRVWDVAEKTQVAELLGHKFGVNCVTFSPNMKEVVSVGTQHDMMIIVWNWKSGNKVASNKVSSKVSAIAYSEDGKCFVTVGNRHVRFWYLEDRRSKINQTVPLAGRSGILGDQKDNFFCDVVSGKGNMCGRFFVITQSGLLCEINEKRHLDKWVELRTKSANCITSGTEHIFVGCSEGVIRVFSATSLHYLCSLPKPHHLGVEITTATTASHMVSGHEDASYPDPKCIAFDDDHKKVTCVYNDRSVYIWDVHDLKRVGKAWSFLYHSGCIWALEVYPQLEEGAEAMLPPGSFLTGSWDDTIRVWNLNTHMPENTAYKRNIYSNELLKIVYSDPSLACLTDVDYNPAGGADKTDTKYGDKRGVRSIRASPDGTHLASGDRQGNIKIYDMKYLNEIRCVEAHDSDVMCLEYSYNKYGQFLATASRDRLIHVFDVEQNYGLVQTLGDHSSSITAVRFTDNGDKLGMISCGADKSILLRNAVATPEFQFQLEHHLATKLTLYDMVIDPSQKYIATACQDRNVRLYNIQSRKEKKCYKGSSGDDGILLRIHLDPSGSFAATACTDKSICIIDFESGELLASIYGHSETITGVKFANDLKHLITVSADGCIFVWRLPSEMTTQIRAKLMELGKESRDADYFRSDQLMMPNPVSVNQSTFEESLPIMRAASVANIPMGDNDSVFSQDFHDGDDEDDDSQSGRSSSSMRPAIKKPLDDSVDAASLAYRFSIGQLPNWAKAKFGEGGSEGSESSQEMVPPKGRWAQRVDRNVEFKSQLDLMSDDESTPSSSDRRRDQLSSSSLSKSLSNSDPRRQTFVVGKQQPGGHNKSVPGLDDFRASTGDLAALSKRDFAIPTRSDTFIYGRGGKASDRFDLLKGYGQSSLDLDDGDDLDTGSDTTEVIYPPTESDSDFYAGSYQVFATEEDKKKPKRNSSGVANLDDVTSESTDPISLEEDEEGTVISNPTTPSDPEKEFPPWDPDKEDFVKDNFEEDLERGIQGLTDSSTPFSPRLSLSARFMSMAKPKQSSSATGGYRSDNWFSRNKMEMTRAMDETRKSLLAMNIRSTSPEEMDDSPSPPVKLDRNSFKPSSYPSSPPAVEQSQESSRLNTSGPLAKKVNKEKERRRSASSKTSEGSSSADSTSPSKTAVRTRPSYFKTTASSRSKVNKDTDVASSMPSSLSRNGDTSKRRSYGKTESKMPSSKLSFYASSPNLALALDMKEDDEHDQDEIPLRNTQKAKEPSPLRIKSMSNLKALADLSRSVPDINDGESSTDSSSTSGGPTHPQRRSVFGPAAKFTSRYSSGMTDKERMPPPPAKGSSSSLSKKRLSQDHRSRSGSTSELTLDEAKSILLGKSGILATPKPAGNVTNLTVAPVSSSLHQAQAGSISSSSSASSASSSSPPGLSSSSSIPGQSDIIPMFEPTPSQLAVAEEIEQTANMLRHQNHANMTAAVYSSDPSNLEASPLDLPERDVPTPVRRPSSSKQHSSMTSLLASSSSTTSSISSYSSPSSQQPTHMSSLSSSSSSSSSQHPGTPHNNTDLIRDENDDKRQSVRDRIAKLNTSNTPKGSPVSVVVSSSFNSKPGRTSSPHRRVLPASPQTLTTSAAPTIPVMTTSAASEATDSSRVSTDTGLGSESELDLQMGGHSAGGAVGPSPKADRSKLALPLVSSPSSLEQVRNCKIALDDLRSQLSKLKDLFAQVDGRTDEPSRVILTMMGQAFHEAQSIIMELASQTPSLSPNVSATISSSSSSSSSSFRPDQSQLTASSHRHTSSSSSSSSHDRLTGPSKTFQPPPPPPSSSSSSSIPLTGSSINTTSSMANGSNDTDSPPSSSSATPKHISSLSDVSSSTIRDLSSQQVAALAATKEVLEPLVSQLSQDLSDGILKLIREKLNQSS